MTKIQNKTANIDINIERSVKDRLKQLAQNQGKIFNEVWQVLVLERFLIRLARSEYRDHFIFKGGLLLAQYLKLGRETSDLDFLIQKIKNESTQIEAVFCSIVTISCEDGFQFDGVSSEVLSHQHMRYPGFRISMRACLGQTKTLISVDVGFGDVVNAEDKSIKLLSTKKSPMFEDEVSLKVYPPESIFSEKIETVFYRGAANSRMKDFHDLWLMHREKDLLDPHLLGTAILATFKNRGTRVEFPVQFNVDETMKLQIHWTAHLREIGKTSKELALPEKISSVLDSINHYLSINCADLFS